MIFDGIDDLLDPIAALGRTAAAITARHQLQDFCFS
jgi:hypothetical protein